MKAISRSISRSAVYSICFISAIFFCLFTPSDLSAKSVFTRRAVYLPGNPLSPTWMSNTETIMRRSAKAGYNMVWFDSYAIMPRLYLTKDPKWIDALKTLKTKAESHGLILCPCSHGQTDPCFASLMHAEAIPVLNTRFKVTGTEAFAIEDTALEIPNGGFEVTKKPNTPYYWNIYGGIIPGKTAFLDSADKRPGSTGSSSFRIENPPKRTKLMSRPIRVRPGRAYEVSIWVKTKTFSNTRDIGIEVRGVDASPRELYRNREHNGVAGTQGWQRENFDFNSLNHRIVQIRVAATDVADATGTVWFDDIEIEEVGLFEIVRRSTLPIAVKSEDGKTYQEGKDYTISSGAEPKEGEQAKLLIPPGSGIANGQFLRVDWFQLGDMRRELPAASYCHPEVWKEVQASANMISDVFGSPPAWYTKPGEWATAYWDPACRPKYKTAGEFMGGAWTGIIEAIKKATNNWNVDTYVIHDMVDPSHNGNSDPYFVVNGTTAGAWRTLHKDAIIMNWNEGHKVESLKFFSGLDPKYPNVYFRQLIHFWSGVDVSSSVGWLPALDKAEAEGMKDGAVVGIEYATWHAKTDGGYDHLEKYAEASAAAGRWAVNDKSWPPAPSTKPLSQANRKTTKLRILPSTSRGQYRIKFEVAQNSHVRLSILNGLGQTVRTLANNRLNAGAHEVRLTGNEIPTGVYFLVLRVSVDDAVSRTLRKWAVL